MNRLLALQEYLQRQLDRETNEPLNRQLYRALRTAILTARLAAGQALPASRNLATALGVARNTVLHAYEQLCAEGYCVSRGGAGTFVANALPDPAPKRVASQGRSAAMPGLSQRAQSLLVQFARS